MQAHILSLHTHFACLVASECGHSAYQIKGKEVYTNIREKL